MCNMNLFRESPRNYRERSIYVLRNTFVNFYVYSHCRNIIYIYIYIYIYILVLKIIVIK